MAAPLCEHCEQFRAMLSQMDVWTINTVSTLCHVLGCLDDHEHLACLGALVREDETRLESTSSRLPPLHLHIALDPTRTKT